MPTNLLKPLRKPKTALRANLSSSCQLWKHASLSVLFLLIIKWTKSRRLEVNLIIKRKRTVIWLYNMIIKYDYDMGMFLTLCKVCFWPSVGYVFDPHFINWLGQFSVSCIKKMKLAKLDNDEKMCYNISVRVLEIKLFKKLTNLTLLKKCAVIIMWG